MRKNILQQQGKKADSFTSITLGESSMALVELKTTLDDATTVASDPDKVGYYVDIPVYLRTNKPAGSTSDTSKGSIYCKLKISNYKSDTIGVDNGELYKAVRVAFLPTGATESKIFGVD